MEDLYKATGHQSYIAIVKLMPQDDSGLIMQNHVFNIKRIQQLNMFCRQDQESPWC